MVSEDEYIYIILYIIIIHFTFFQNSSLNIFYASVVTDFISSLEWKLEWDSGSSDLGSGEVCKLSDNCYNQFLN